MTKLLIDTGYSVKKGRLGPVLMELKEWERAFILFYILWKMNNPHIR